MKTISRNLLLAMAAGNRKQRPTKTPKANTRPRDGVGRELDKASDLYLLRKLPQCLKAAKAVVRREPNNYWANILLGHVLADTGKLKCAHKYYKKAIALKPKAFHAYEAKANALFEEGRYEEAEICAKTALQLAAIRPRRCSNQLELIYDTLTDSLAQQGKR
ncbi:MAG: tetratricopeptide repeat protein, partial [Verrucomicrobiia bacterium]